jgi:outer membrane protein
MNLQFRYAAAVAAFLVWSASASAQTPTAPSTNQSDLARQDALVREAVARYEAGLQQLETAPDVQRSVGTPAPGGVRELRLADVVQLALEKNLDIAVERLNPQSVDLQIAAVKNQYRPVASSTIGQSAQMRLPNSLLSGGQRVNNDTTTYNFGFNQSLAKFGGNYTLSFTNSRLVTTDAFANFNPTYTAGLRFAYTQPLLRGLFIDNLRQQLLVTQINREISEEDLRATITTTLANVRNAYWDLVFSQNAVEVAQRALELANKLVEDNRARVEVGTLAPLDIVQAEAEAATRRQTLAAAEATMQTAELALKRFLVSGTEDPLWRQQLQPIDLPSLAPAPTDIEGAVRRAIERRTDLVSARKNLESNDVSIKYYRNQSLPAVDLITSYGAQGIGGTQFQRTGDRLNSVVTGTTPGGYADALKLLTNRDYPNWNLQVNMSYNIGESQSDAQYARARVQRSQSQARLRALELQVATEVTNAAITVQSNLKRVEAAQAARELAEKRLEAEQSKFDVGMSTNFFVVQAQRDLRDAQNTELRALADYRKSLVTFERAQEAPGGSNGNSGGQPTGGQTTGGQTTGGGTNTQQQQQQQ